MERGEQGFGETSVRSVPSVTTEFQDSAEKLTHAFEFSKAKLLVLD